MNAKQRLKLFESAKSLQSSIMTMVNAVLADAYEVEPEVLQDGKDVITMSYFSDNGKLLYQMIVRVSVELVIPEKIKGEQ